MKNPKVLLETNFGNITIELNPEKAPKTVDNFLKYFEKGHYADTIFHRVIPGFMIQGGGFLADMSQKPTLDPIENEATNGLKNDKYTIAMARTNEPHTATCQFFINTANNNFLNHTAPIGSGWGYCVFGKVIDGFDVVDKIESVKTGSHDIHRDMPLVAVVIKTATLLKEIA